MISKLKKKKGSVPRRGCDGLTLRVNGDVRIEGWRDSAMDSKERVMATINHKIPDRIPVHVMGFDAPEAFYERFNVSTDVDLKIALGLDTRQIGPSYV